MDSLNYLFTQYWFLEFNQFLSEYWHLVLVGSLLVILSIGFLLRFILPALRLSRELVHSITEISGVRAQLNGSIVELDEIAEKAMDGPALRHLWEEYIKTLHPQRQEDEHGQKRIIHWRATVLAETFLRNRL